MQKSTPVSTLAFSANNGQAEVAIRMCFQAEGQFRRKGALFTGLAGSDQLPLPDSANLPLAGPATQAQCPVEGQHFCGRETQGPEPSLHAPGDYWSVGGKEREAGTASWSHQGRECPSDPGAPTP